MLPDHKIHASNRPYFHIDFKHDIEFLRVIHVRLIFKIFMQLSFVSKYLVISNNLVNHIGVLQFVEMTLNNIIKKNTSNEKAKSSF